MLWARIIHVPLSQVSHAYLWGSLHRKTASNDFSFKESCTHYAGPTSKWPPCSQFPSEAINIFSNERIISRQVLIHKLPHWYCMISGLITGDQLDMDIGVKESTVIGRARSFEAMWPLDYLRKRKWEITKETEDVSSKTMCWNDREAQQQAEAMRQWGLARMYFSSLYVCMKKYKYQGIQVQCPEKEFFLIC